MGCTVYLTFRDLPGPESSYCPRSREGWKGWALVRINFMATAPGEAINISSGNTGLIPSYKMKKCDNTSVGRDAIVTADGEATSLGKEGSSEFRNSMSSA